MEINPFDFAITSCVWRGRFMGGTFVHNSVQSMCYDSRKRRYIVGFAEPGNVAALVAMKDLSFAEDAVVQVARGLPLDHCNDLVYVAEDHKIYAVGGDWWVAVVDPDTLTVERKIPVNLAAWSLAKYENGDFFVHDGGRGEQYCHDFSSSVTVSMNDREMLAAAIPGLTGCWQGAIVLDGMPYMIFNEFSTETGKPVSFVLFSCEMGEDRTIYRAETGWEIESADIVGGMMKVAYNSLYRYGGGEWEMSEMNGKMIFGEFEHRDFPAGTEVSLDLKKMIPEGYALYSANVGFIRNGSTERELPTMNAKGACIARIIRISKTKVIVKSSEAYTDCTFRVTGFCRKKETGG